MTKEKNERGLYYGSRKSDKLVRCYPKPELGVFRVELELHSSPLRRHNISTLDDFVFLPDIIYPRHVQFVEPQWEQLYQYLINKFGTEGSQMIAGAEKRKSSMRSLRRYLKRKGIPNGHRFLKPLAMNAEVVRALDKWARQFNRG